MRHHELPIRLTKTLSNGVEAVDQRRGLPAPAGPNAAIVVVEGHPSPPQKAWPEGHSGAGCPAWVRGLWVHH